MKRTPIVAGNWKMNKTPNESVAFAKELTRLIESFENVERVVAPTFLSLTAVADALRETPVQVASQDAHWEADGAFTSQISVTMLSSICRLHHCRSLGMPRLFE